MANYFKNDEQRNAANCAIIAVDSTNNIVFDEADTTIALLGVHNLIVVRTGDASEWPSLTSCNYWRIRSRRSHRLSRRPLGWRRLFVKRKSITLLWEFHVR